MQEKLEIACKRAEGAEGAKSDDEEKDVAFELVSISFSKDVFESIKRFEIADFPSF